MKQTKDGILLNLKILPNASKNEITVSQDGIKVKITAQPVDGKANKALIGFLSKELKIPKTSIEVVKGNTNKEKIILFRVFDEEKVKFLKEKFSN